MVALLLLGAFGFYLYDGIAAHELIDAVKSGNTAKVRGLLEGGADPNLVVREFGGRWDGRYVTEWSALHFAAMHGDAETMRLLLEAGGDPGIRNATDDTLLEVSVGVGEIETTLVLLEATATLPDAERIVELTHIRGGWEERDLAGHTEDKILASWLAERRGQEPTELIAGVRGGDAERVGERLERGADPSEPDAFGWTPLIWAAGIVGDTDAMRALLAGGADPNQASSEGWTPLMAAVQAGEAERVALLLEAGADRSAVEAIGGRSVHDFELHRGRERVIHALAGE